jgi:hypothetical protein
MKKLFAFLSVAVLTFSLAACGGGNELSDEITDDPDIDYGEETLTIWSFTDELQAQGDLQYFEDNYTAEGKEYEGMEIEYVEIPTADYLTTILPTLRTGSGAPDVFTGELDMILNFMRGGYLANLEAMMEADEDVDFDDTKDDFIDYIWEAGMDSEETLRSLSWQITPGGIFFKTDMAEAVWGGEAGFPSDDSADDYNQQVSDWVSAEKFDTLQGLIDASQEVKDHDANWRLFPNDDAIRWFSQQSDTPVSWLADDTLINPDRLENEEVYMEAVADLYGEDLDDSLTANVDEWSGAWYQGMGQSFDAADGTTYQTMAYSLPTWGLFHVLEPSVELVDGNGDTCVADDLSEAELEECTPKGNWGVASGPNSYFWGGTYLNIYQGSELKEPSYDFVKSMLFDTDRMTERAANGDVYARKSIMDEITADYEGNPVLGGMNHYEFFLSEADKISLEHITNYDRTLNEIMGDAVNDYKQGEVDTKAEAFADFYQELRNAHPEIYRSSGLPYQD